jgi:hypothetical protein
MQQSGVPLPPPPSLGRFQHLDARVQSGLLAWKLFDQCFTIEQSIHKRVTCFFFLSFGGFKYV